MARCRSLSDEFKLEAVALSRQPGVTMHRVRSVTSLRQPFALCEDRSFEQIRVSPMGRLRTGHGASQFSTGRFGTFENSRVLAVTTQRLVASAWAAMSRSFGPIGLPASSRWRRRLAQ